MFKKRLRFSHRKTLGVKFSATIQTHLTPAGFNIICLSPHFGNFLRYHGLGMLVGLPLLGGTHGLRVELVHTRRLFLYMRNNGNVGNASLHKCLCQDSVRSVGILGVIWAWALSWRFKGTKYTHVGMSSARIITASNGPHNAPFLVPTRLLPPWL